MFKLQLKSLRAVKNIFPMPLAHPELGQAWRRAGSNCAVLAATVQSLALRAARCRVPSPFLDNFLSCVRGSGFGHHCFLFLRMCPNEIKTFSLWPVKFRATVGGYFSWSVKVIVSHRLHPGMPASCLTGLSVSVSVAAWCIVSSRVEHGALSGQDLILGTCWGKGLSGEVPQGAPLTSSEWAEFCSPRWAVQAVAIVCRRALNKGASQKELFAF